MKRLLIPVILSAGMIVGILTYGYGGGGGSAVSGATPTAAGIVTSGGSPLIPTTATAPPSLAIPTRAPSAPPRFSVAPLQAATPIVRVAVPPLPASTPPDPHQVVPLPAEAAISDFEHGVRDCLQKTHQDRAYCVANEKATGGDQATGEGPTEYVPIREHLP